MLNQLVDNVLLGGYNAMPGAGQGVARRLLGCVLLCHPS